MDWKIRHFEIMWISRTTTYFEPEVSISMQKGQSSCNGDFNPKLSRVTSKDPASRNSQDDSISPRFCRANLNVDRTFSKLLRPRNATFTADGFGGQAIATFDTRPKVPKKIIEEILNRTLLTDDLRQIQAETFEKIHQIKDPMLKS